jgi:prephenate dehydratase/prephenate dehydrogenase
MDKKVIGIIGGRGAMGKYFTEFFERSGYKVIISDRRTHLTNKQLAKKADVVIVSVPIDKTEDVINEVAPHVKKSGLLMDFTSFKVFPMKAMNRTKGSYLGCHPLFGPTNQIEGQLVILCAGRGNKWFNWWKDLLIKNKVIVKELTAKKHDELMAYIQALTHFSDIALADTLRKSKIPIKKFIDYQSPAYRLELDMMGRILAQDPNLYANIQIKNPLSPKVIRDFIKSCQDLGETIDKKDIKKNINYFKKCARYLGDFRKIAMDESDKILNCLNITSEKSEALDKKIRYDITVLGPKNTYSDMAVQKYSPKSKVYYASSIHEVFDLVNKGKIKEGLVPIENSLTGSVRETVDELYDSNVLIEKVIAQPIHLSLIGIKKIPLNKIKTIYSHSQPFLQSRKFIKYSCSTATCISVASTTNALERVASEKHESVTAIASPLVAKMYGLKIIRDSIEDHHDNTTYFAVIKKGTKRHATKSAKNTSIAFNFSKDILGSLFSVLQDFADNKINMTKIESRPSTRERGEYVFYIDFEGNINNPKVKKVLQKIKNKVARLKVLGCY